MTWTWRLEQADGSELGDEPTVNQPAHANRSDAESWMGEHWRALADAGVVQVTLYEGDAKIYGPMSLSET